MSTPPAVDLFPLNIRKDLLGSTVQILRLNPNQMPRKFVQDNLLSSSIQRDFHWCHAMATKLTTIVFFKITFQLSIG